MEAMASILLSTFICLWSPCTIPNWVQSLEFKYNVPKSNSYMAIHNCEFI